MKKSLFTKLFMVLYICCALPLAAHASAAPKILVSIKPLHSLVAAVTDGVTNPDLLLDGAQSPHDYALRPSDMKKIADADIIIYISKDLETFLPSVLKSAGSGKVVVQTSNKDGVTLFPFRSPHVHLNASDGHNNRLDPHLWLAPDNAIAIVNAVLTTLAERDPSRVDIYRSNSVKAVSAISNAALHAKAALAPWNNITAPYLVYHDSYQYFERYFGLSSLGAISASDDQPPSAKRLQELHQLVADHPVRCLFSEPQFSAATVEAIGKDLGVRVELLDPLGTNSAPGKDLYPQIIGSITQQLVSCLNHG